MFDEMSVETYRLRLEKFAIAWLVRNEPDLAALPLEVQCRYEAEAATRRCVLSLRVPSKVLQDNSVIASYPDGLWQSVKAALKMKHRVVDVRMTEYLVFPAVKVPDPLADEVRVYVQTELTLGPSRHD